MIKKGISPGRTERRFGKNSFKGKLNRTDTRRPRRSSITDDKVLHTAKRADKAPRHNRGVLLHYDAAGLYQMITYRLADSLPMELLKKMDAELQRMPESKRGMERRIKIEQYLDAGHGACLLRDPAIAGLVIENLLHHDKKRYELLAWVVMPNHVHVLIKICKGFSMGRITQGWKGFTGKKIAELSGETGAVWQRECMDRFIRDERHLNEAASYIQDNPVKAGLARVPGDYPWSSFSRRSGAGAEE